MLFDDRLIAVPFMDRYGAEQTPARTVLGRGPFSAASAKADNMAEK